MVVGEFVRFTLPWHVLTSPRQRVLNAYPCVLQMPLYILEEMLAAYVHYTITRNGVFANAVCHPAAVVECTGGLLWPRLHGRTPCTS